MKNNANHYRDWWLKKYHGIDSQDVIKLHPEEARSGNWFKLYPCTQEQYNEWKKWALEEAAKDNRTSLKIIDRLFWQIELDCAPTIK